MSLIVRIGFGIVVLSMAFLVFVFTRAYRDPTKRLDHKYKIVAAALAIGSLGVGIWAINPLSQSFGGPPLHPVGMGIASTLILLASCSIIGSTAIGGSKATLRLFLLFAAAWALGCLVGAWL